MLVILSEQHPSGIEKPCFARKKFIQTKQINFVIAKFSETQ